MTNESNIPRETGDAVEHAAACGREAWMDLRDWDVTPERTRAAFTGAELLAFDAAFDAARKEPL